MCERWNQTAHAESCQWPKGQGSCDLAGILPGSLLWPCVALGACCSFQKPRTQSCTAWTGSEDWSSAREGIRTSQTSSTKYPLSPSLTSTVLTLPVFFVVLYHLHKPILPPWRWHLPFVRIKQIRSTYWTQSNCLRAITYMERGI